MIIKRSRLTSGHLWKQIQDHSNWSQKRVPHSALPLAIHFIFFDCVTVCENFMCQIPEKNSKTRVWWARPRHERYGLPCPGCSWNHQSAAVALHVSCKPGMAQRKRKGSGPDLVWEWSDLAQTCCPAGLSVSLKLQLESVPSGVALSQTGLSVLLSAFAPLHHFCCLQTRQNNNRNNDDNNNNWRDAA